MWRNAMNEAVRSWVERSCYDLDTAKAMLASGRYLYVVFCCQQAAEKALKAVVASRTGALPPRIHNLLRLAEAAQIELPTDKIQFLGELSAYYIQSRYPEEMSGLASSITRETAQKTLNITEETTQWLFSILE
jgi:HEPN domain-containing protein